MNQRSLLNTFERFGTDFQNSLIKSLLIDTKFFEDIFDIISPELFESVPHSYLIGQIKRYYETYRAYPEVEHLESIVRQEKDPTLIEEVRIILKKIQTTSSNLNFIKEESLKFCLNQKVRIAIEESSRLLAAEDYDKIRKIITESTQFGKKDLGMIYEKDILKRLINSRRPITTGYSLLDAVFDGGIGGGELAVICGGPSIGKSMFLINFAKRAMDAGRKVLYYTLELAEGLVGKRFDALITGININDLELRKDEVLQLVPEYVEKHNGSLIIKQYPTKKATVRDLQHHIDLLKRNSNWIPDMIFVDYADILKSNYRGEAKKRFELENIYEELRGVAVELNIPVITASQSNKEGTYGEFVSLLNMSESFSKAAISDIVLGITRKLNGGIVNTGTCYIAKNRGFGRDGLVLPVTFQTNKATVTIPSTPELIEKVKTGELRDLAKYYFDTNNSGGSMDDLYSKLK